MPSKISSPMRSAPAPKARKAPEGKAVSRGTKLRARLGNEDGAVTIEAALGLSSLVVVSALMVGVLATLASYVAAIDGAGAAARAHAIGQSFEPARGRVSIVENSGLITATVSIPVVRGEVSADAVFPVEN